MLICWFSYHLSLMTSKTEYMREWRKKNREKVLAYKRDYRQKHWKEYLEYRKDRREKRRALLSDLLGTKCFMCGVNGSHGERTVWHEKNGIAHPQLTDVSIEWFKKHIDKFVTLCYRCHNLVTELTRQWGLIWEDFELLKSIMNERMKK